MKGLVYGLLLSTALNTFSGPVLAAQTPTPEKNAEGKEIDPRMVFVPYSPKDVIPLLIPNKGRTNVVLSSVETEFYFAKSLPGWELEDAGNTFSIRATAGAVTTVAHVVSPMPDGTNRYYTFELNAAEEGVKLPPTNPAVPGNSVVASNDPANLGVSAPQKPLVPYLTVRLTYEQEERKAKAAAAAATAARRNETRRAAPAQPISAAPRDGSAIATLRQDASAIRRRCNFMWRGSPEVLPQTACQNGAKTFFYWPGQMPVSGAFLIAEDGTEHSVNQSANPDQPGLIEVPTTSRWWRLRRGDVLVAEMYDASYNEIGLDTGTGTLSPRVRTRVQTASGALR